MTKILVVDDEAPIVTDEILIITIKGILIQTIFLIPVALTYSR